MSFVSQAKTKRLLALHGWSGTVLGLLLYIVIFTGAIVVVADEIGDWSRGAIGHESRLGTKVDHRFRMAARSVDRDYYERVTISRFRSGDFNYTFRGRAEDPSTGQDIEVVARLRVDAETGEILERWEGPATEQPRAPRTALRQFRVYLRVSINPFDCCDFQRDVRGDGFLTVSMI